MTPLHGNRSFLHLLLCMSSIGAVILIIQSSMVRSSVTVIVESTKSIQTDARPATNEANSHPFSTANSTTTTLPKHSQRRKTWNETKSETNDLLSLTPETPYLNAKRLLQSGHFHRVAQGRAFFVVSPEVCSLQRPGTPNRKAAQVYKTPIEGIFYNKVPKAASSTLAGINRRLALHWGHRLHGSSSSLNVSVLLSPHDDTAQSTSCTHQEAHVIGAGRYYGNRVKGKSFLWGSIRDPAARALSRIYYYQISQAGVKENDEKIINLLRTNYNPQSGCISRGQGGFQLKYLALNQLDEWVAWSQEYPELVQQPDIVEEQVYNVTRQYDFIAVVERMDESLVALQLLLGLRVGDILSVSAKVAGDGFVQQKKSKCVPIQKTRQSPAVRAYLESDEWQAVNYGDYLLYAAANKSLDLTVEQLGRERFHKALLRYKDAQRIVNQECMTEAFFPCSANGTVQMEVSRNNCYNYDEGCGYPCIDRLAQERGW